MSAKKCEDATHHFKERHMYCQCQLLQRYELWLYAQTIVVESADYAERQAPAPPSAVAVEARR